MVMVTPVIVDPLSEQLSVPQMPLMPTHGLDVKSFDQSLGQKPNSTTNQLSK
jgi:hypothetical protein